MNQADIDRLLMEMLAFKVSLLDELRQLNNSARRLATAAERLAGPEATGSSDQ